MEKKLKKSMVLVMALSVLVVLLTLAMPFNMILLFMWVIPSDSISSIKTIAMAALAGLGFMVVFDVLRFAFLRRFSVYLNQVLGEKILLNMFKERANQQKGESFSAMNDLSTVRSFLQSPVSTALLDGMISPVLLIIVFVVSPLMGFLSLICIFIILGNKLAGRKQIRELLRSANQRFFQANSFARECVNNAQTIQAMGMQQQFLDRFRRLQDHVVLDQTVASEKAGVHSAVAKTTGWIMQVILMGAGTYLIIHGNIDPGLMIIAVIIAGRVVMPMQVVVDGWEQYQNAKDAFFRLREFWTGLKAEEEKSRLELPRPEGALKAEVLTYGAGGKPIIRAISFDLEPGQTLGIIGPSGAGKTTLARLLTGAVKPQAGVLRLDGADMHQWDQDQLGVHIGYLPQEVELFAGTISRNIARFREADPEQIREAARLAGIDEIIMGFPDKYETMLEERGHNFPGGFRQRIGLARALFGNPSLLILDEPDASLDQEGLQALEQVIDHARKEKISLVLVTHRQKLLLYTDKLLMLKDGQVNMYGPSAQVLQKLLGTVGKPRAVVS